MNRDVFSLIARFWSAAHCAYYRHVCKTWASWLGVLHRDQKKVDIVNDIAPWDDVQTLAYVHVACGWRLFNDITEETQQTMIKQVLSFNAVDTFKFTIMHLDFFIDDTAKLVHILPDNPSTKVLDIFDVLILNVFWSFIWELCCNDRSHIASMLMDRYKTWIVLSNECSYMIVVDRERHRMIYTQFYRILTKYFIVNACVKDTLQAYCAGTHRTNADDLIQLVKDMNYVSAPACKALKERYERHDEVSHLCMCMSSSHKRIKLY